MSFTASFLAGLASALSASVLRGAGRRLGRSLAEPERTAAVKRSCEAGIVALLERALLPGAEERDLLGHIFRTFFEDRKIGVEVGRQVADLLKGHRLDRGEMEELFTDAGFDPESLPGLDLDSAWTAFEGAFVESATRQGALQGEIQIEELRRQTGLQGEILARIEALVEFLTQAQTGTVGITADQITAQNVAGVQIQVNLSQLASGLGPAEVPGEAEPDWERRYLTTLVAKCDPLDLTPIDEAHPAGDGGFQDPVRISQVFTQLHLKGLSRRPNQSVSEVLQRSSRPEDGDPVSGNLPARTQGDDKEEPIPIQAVEAVGAAPRLVVLGQPGGGKSTLVSHIATQLARYRLEGSEGDLALPGWPEDRRPLPVRIVLRHFAAWLPSHCRRGDAGQVWGFIEHQLGSWGLEEAYEPLKKRLWDEGGLVFFDGLDEVHESDAEKKRSLLRDSIAEFARPLETTTVVVTCREYAYRQDDAWVLPPGEFPVVELASFGEEQIQAFARTWYRVVVGPQKDWSESQSRREAENLYQAIQGWPHLKVLAGSPLLLTLMAQLHGRDGYLPQDRADLYQRSVNLLLAHWENRIVRDLQGGSTVERDVVMRLGVPTRVLRTALEEVAFAAHERQERQPERSEGAADIPREDLREALVKALESVDEADRVIAYVQERAGLLLAVDRRTYRFPHRTFQEYLAAQYLLDQAEYDSLLEERVKRDLAWWREVFLLAAGSRKTPRIVSDLVEKLVPRGPRGEPVEAGKAEEVRLAAQALEETGFGAHVQKEQEDGAGRFSRIHETVQRWLETGLGSDETLTSRLRADCGVALAGLGDVRSEVMTLDGMEFCPVPAADFWMGSQDFDEDERPLHLNRHLDYDFLMGRYPVTVSQLREAVAGGMEEPADPDSLDGVANHPVVRVNWFEARRLCSWLGQKWREAGILPQGWAVALPSEAEWEKAARGGMEVPVRPRWSRVGQVPARGEEAKPLDLKPNEEPQRSYPWAGEFMKNRCNSSMMVGRTSTVGAFPGGMSPYGCQEMSGNVWEWTRSMLDSNRKFFPYPYEPGPEREVRGESDTASGFVLRGGSFGSGPRHVRCAFRRGDGATYRNRVVGFRLALVPSGL